MISKTLIKKLQMFYIISQLISLFELWKVGLTQELFQGMRDVLFASIPMCALGLYILVQIYQIVYKNIDTIKHASYRLLCLFYGDYLPKTAICIFSFLCYDGTVKMMQGNRYIVVGILIAIDMCLEVMTIMGFSKLEQKEISIWEKD